MATAAELETKWTILLEEWRRLDVTVSGPKVVAEFIADLTALRDASALDAVTLKEASLEGGYSVDRLQHLVASGDIENVGQRGRPRIRRCDVPKKPGYLRPDPTHGQLDERRRIVASVTTRSTPE